MLKQKNFLSLVSQLSQLQSGFCRCRLDIEASKELKWSLYFYLGRLMWAGGGADPLERWQRLLNHYCPGINQSTEANLKLSQFEGYNFLAGLLKQDIKKRSQVMGIVKDTLMEVLFDILQYEHQLKFDSPNRHLSFTYDEQNYPKTALTLARIDKTLGEVQQQWQLWQQRQLTPYSPNLVPIIDKPKRLLHNLRNSKEEYQALAKLVDGKRTLRSLALELRQPLPSLTLSFVNYVNCGVMSFVEVQQGRENKFGNSGDYLLEKPRKIEFLLNGKSLTRLAKDSRPLVMCIDDSPTVCTQMKQIITGEGCRFFGIQDPIKAIPSLLKIQPNLIFLDLVMPIVNGYELCAQIRRISQAKNIPIVILTGKDGLIDRVRSKVVGANDFIAKPINQKRVLSILRKHSLIKP
ncbi:MAG: response regulator [Xenococcaceae cyanobacterium MO_188.B19]|nr:response regulator [Xenococcaceae cyanobacterium MO_188.B19]